MRETGRDIVSSIDLQALLRKEAELMYYTSPFYQHNNNEMNNFQVRLPFILVLKFPTGWIQNSPLYF